jgi:hypothetical protein
VTKTNATAAQAVSVVSPHLAAAPLGRTRPGRHGIQLALQHWGPARQEVAEQTAPIAVILPMRTAASAPASFERDERAAHREHGEAGGVEEVHGIRTRCQRTSGTRCASSCHRPCRRNEQAGTTAAATSRVRSPRPVG